MAQNFAINGVSYPFPDVAEQNWGQNVTNWAAAVTAGMLQKAGGAFTLSAEVDFGATFGIRAAYLRSKAALPASTGVVRLGTSDFIAFRNFANSADLPLGVNASNQLTFDGSPLISGSPGGSDTQVQFNSSGSFAGNAGMTFDPGTQMFTAANLTVTSISTLASVSAQTLQMSGNFSTFAEVDIFDSVPPGLAPGGASRLISSSGLLMVSQLTGAFKGVSTYDSPTTNMMTKFSGVNGLMVNSLMRDTGTNVVLTSGQFLVPVGTAAAPPYTFTGFLSKGFYSPSANAIGVSIAGAEAFRFDATGLGVGVTPNTSLDIIGAFSQRGMVAPSLSPAGQGRIYFDSGLNKYQVSENGAAYSDLAGGGGGGISGSGTTNRIPKFTAATTVGDSLLSDDGTNVAIASGSFGVGTTNPLSLIHAAKNNDGVLITRASGQFGTRIFQDFAGGLIRQQIKLSDDITWQDYFRIGEGNTSGTSHLFIQPTAGNVSIGSANTPANKVDILNGGVSIGFIATAAPANGLITLGSVGIGTGIVGERLTVEGNLRLNSGGIVKLFPSDNSSVSFILDAGSGAVSSLRFRPGDASDVLTLTQTGFTGAGINTPHSVLQSGGSFSAKYTALSANTTLDTTHAVQSVDATSGNKVITLPASTGISGRIYVFNKPDSTLNTVTLTAFAGDTINGQSTFVLRNQYDSVLIFSGGGTSWFANFSAGRVAAVGQPVQTLETNTAGDHPIAQTFQVRTTTTDATPTPLATIPLDDETVYIVTFHTVVGRRTGGIAGTPGDVTSAQTNYTPIVIGRSGGGAPVLKSTINSLPENFGAFRDNGNSDISLDVSGNDLVLSVYGDIANNYTWQSRYTVEKFAN